MHWKWLIIVYLFLGGLGAGAYLASFAAEKGWLGKNSSLDKIGYYIAPPIIAIGTVLLIFDLGQGMYKPWLLIGLLKNFTSVMTWGVYILALFIVVGFIKAFFVWKEQKAPSFVDYAGVLLAFATMAYTGLLIAVVEAVPFWSTWIMPVLFVVSAISTGLSITVLLSLFIQKDKYVSGYEDKAHIWLIAIELVVVAGFVAIMYYGVNGPVAQESLDLVLTGVYSYVFWGYFIALGLIFPLIAFIYQASKAKATPVKASYSASGQEAATASEPISYLTVVSDIAVIIGGFALRAIIILAAIPVWDGFTL